MNFCLLMVLSSVSKDIPHDETQEKDYYLVMILSEHPIEVTLRNAPKLPKGSVLKQSLEQIKESRRLQAAGLEEFISLKELIKSQSKITP